MRNDNKPCKRAYPSFSSQAGRSKLLQQLDAQRKQYSRSWRHNANAHHAQGHYDWMAAQVAGHPRTLEIGCGVGHSTLALLKNGHQVVCVEENLHCISATQLLLSEHGFSVAVIERSTAHSLDEASYRLDYAAIVDAPRADCLIIEGDALKDPQLERWLKTQPVFDSVACWLIGTHLLRARNVLLDAALITTPLDYRVQVQHNVYALADAVLRAGGILNVIDREPTPSTQRIYASILASHRDQARGSSLDVGSLSYTPQLETPCAETMQLLEHTAQALGHEGPLTFSLCSVTSVKH
ncbi:hypothetical protein DCO48_17260 [Pseudomonas sp. SDI]|uniref:hypothetical protein n=1 Tax=Pseudomonas sp. SDI TaxID=2170734 RepID=UPI000DE7A8BD|nr:hypothetical protein [Pseudomonas sp. SDI]PWB31409.1 hypothetical protein DCO48_17260 [Pseudomonas sp. SDI]